MDLISVIVPVYKVEPYLDRCVRSIVDQTYENLEIILVDDGSPDNCPAICDRWAEKDDRITVIHEKNNGSAFARNIALDRASGNYIAFVDSDDFIHPQMLSRLLSIAEKYNCDIVECDYEKGTEYSFPDFELNSKPVFYQTLDALRENINDNLFTQVIWNKLYRQTVIGTWRFTEGRFIDDEFWTYKTIGSSKSLAHIKEKLYFYRQQEDSLMHQKYSVRRLDAIDAQEEKLKYIDVFFPELTAYALGALWLCCRYQYQMSLKYLDKQGQNTALKRIQAKLKNHPISKSVLDKYPVKEKVWLLLQKVSFKGTCKLRNFLKIGF